MMAEIKLTGAPDTGLDERLDRVIPVDMPTWGNIKPKRCDLPQMTLLKRLKVPSNHPGFARNGLRTRVLAVLGGAALCSVLTLGLWPFHAPRNEVAWLESQNGLRVGRFGTIISSSGLKAETSRNDTGGSLEVWLQPRRSWGNGTILAFHAPENSLQFSLHQSLVDLELQTMRRNAGAVRFYADDVFHGTGPVFITITSGPQGTAVYLRGALAKRTLNFRLSANEFTGTVILGDSPGQTDTWSGRVFGVALYHCDLAAPQVLRHYQTWTQRGRPQIAEDERNVALYLFDEQTGNVAHNSANGGADLHIPEKYTVVDQILLEPAWREFRMSSSYWGAAVKNIVGFVPLGFCFYAYFACCFGTKRAAVLAVICGFVVSLSIEVVQAYLPTRDSGTTDIITNTLGTCIGLALYRWLTPTLARFVPWLPLPIPRK